MVLILAYPHSTETEHQAGFAARVRQRTGLAAIIGVYATP